MNGHEKFSDLSSLVLFSIVSRNKSTLNCKVKELRLDFKADSKYFFG